MATRLRAARIAAGLAQLELARRADTSRQSLLAIESGRATPSVTLALSLARVLGTTVEALFGAASTSEHLPVEDDVTGRAVVAQIDGRWVAHPLPASDASRAAAALATRTSGGHAVELLEPIARAQDTILLAGCAPALGVLCDRLNAASGRGVFRWLSRSSHAAVTDLAARRVHLAGTHLVDGRGEPSLTHVRPDRDLLLITLAHWEMGLVVAPKNPLGLRDASALVRPRLRVVAREKGAGARKLLDDVVRKAGAPPRRSKRAPHRWLLAGGHLEVAHAVAIGAADVGVATRDAALAHGLSFVPLARERFDLALASSDASDPRIARLLDALASGAWRRELEALGYEASRSGDVVAELRAA